MKKSLFKFAVTVASLFAALSVMADSFTWVIPPTTATNLLAAPMRVTSATLIGTNAVTLGIYDSPNTGLTNYYPAFTNYTRYATNVSQLYTDFFGKPTTNWLTNALVLQTNSNPAATNYFLPNATYSVLSNSTLIVPNLSMLFVNGVTVSNQSANTLTLTLTYTGQ